MKTIIKSNIKYTFVFFFPGAIHILRDRPSACLYLIVCVFLWVMFIVSTRVIVSTYGLAYLLSGLLVIHIGSLLYERFKAANNRIAKPIKLITLTFCLVIFYLIFFAICIQFGKSLLGIKLFSIVSISMTPTIQKGDVIVSDTWLDTARLVEGDVIVFMHPFRPNIYAVKRISYQTDEGLFFVTGDNPDNSVDSRAFGAISEKDVVARATVIIRGFKLVPIENRASGEGR